MQHSKMCETCSQTFETPREDARFCSVSCSSSRKRVQPLMKSCEVCSLMFEAHGEAARFCSSLCFGKSLKRERSSKNCTVCSRPYVPHRESQRYCSISCMNRGTTKPPLTKECVWCEGEFQTPYAKRRKVCCSRSCASSLSNAKMDREAVNARISKTKRERIASGELVYTGHPHSEETKVHLSELATQRFSDPTKNPMFGRRHDDVSKDAMSKTKAERRAQGLYGWKAGHCVAGHQVFPKAGPEPVFFRSSWERRAMEMLQEDPEVVSFQVEPTVVPYERHEGGRSHLRHYVPDFLIERVDGRKVLMEVKPKCFLEAAVNVAKWTAARKVCEEQGWTFEVWTQDRLWPDGPPAENVREA